MGKIKERSVNIADQDKLKGYISLSSKKIKSQKIRNNDNYPVTERFQ